MHISCLSFFFSCRGHSSKSVVHLFNVLIFSAYNSMEHLQPRFSSAFLCITSYLFTSISSWMWGSAVIELLPRIMISIRNWVCTRTVKRGWRTAPILLFSLVMIPLILNLVFFHFKFKQPLVYLILRIFTSLPPTARSSRMVDCGQNSLISVTLRPRRLPSCVQLAFHFTGSIRPIFS